MGTARSILERDHGINMGMTGTISLPYMHRHQLIEFLRDCGFKEGAEVGVASGEHALDMCRTIPDLHLTGVDPWAHVDGFRSFRGATLAAWHELAYESLAPYNVTILETVSMEAVRKFPGDYFDFVYLDGAHDFRHIAEDIYEWYGRVKPGGVLCGHDYVHEVSRRYACHVDSIVRAFVEAFCIPTLFILGDGGRRSKGKLTDPYEWMIIK